MEEIKDNPGVVDQHRLLQKQHVIRCSQRNDQGDLYAAEGLHAHEH